MFAKKPRTSGLFLPFFCFCFDFFAFVTKKRTRAGCAGDRASLPPRPETARERGEREDGGGREAREAEGAGPFLGPFFQKTRLALVSLFFRSVFSSFSLISLSLSLSFSLCYSVQVFECQWKNGCCFSVCAVWTLKMRKKMKFVFPSFSFRRKKSRVFFSLFLLLHPSTSLSRDQPQDEDQAHDHVLRRAPLLELHVELRREGGFLRGELGLELFLLFFELGEPEGATGLEGGLKVLLCEFEGKKREGGLLKKVRG